MQFVVAVGQIANLIIYIGEPMPALFKMCFWRREVVRDGYFGTEVLLAEPAKFGVLLYARPAMLTPCVVSIQGNIVSFHFHI